MAGRGQAAWQYGAAAVVTAAALAARAMLDPWLGDHLPLITLFAAVAAAEWLGGYRPAAAVAVGGYLAADVLFIGPRGRLGLDTPRDVIGLLAYLASCGVVVWFGEAMRAARARAAAEADGRRAAQADAADAHRLAADVLDSITDVYYTVDPAGRVRAANAPAERYFGRPRAALVGRHVWDLFPEARGSAFEGHYRRVLETGEPAEFEVRSPVTGRWVQVRAFRCAEGVSAFVRDVTDRKRAEADRDEAARQLRERAEEVETLFDLAPVAIYRAHDPACRRITGNRAAATLVAAPPGANLSKSAPPDEQPAVRAFRGGAEVAAEDLPAQRAARGEEVRGDEFELRLPDGRAVHVLGWAAPLHDAAGGVRGSLTALADVTPLKRTEARLRDEQERARRLADELAVQRTLLDAFLESVPVPLGFLDRDGRFLRVNRAAAEASGLPAEAHLGLPVGDVFPDLWPALGPLYRRALETGDPARNQEVEVGDAAAGRSWSVNLAPVRVGADVIGVGFALVETTAARRREAALRASEAEYRSLFEMAGVGNAEVDLATGRFLRVNRKYCDMLGYGPDELRGLTFLDVTHPDDRDRNQTAITPFMRDGADGFGIEKRYVRKDGRVVWVHLTASPIRDADGRPVRLLGSAQDVTARRQSEERFRAVQEASLFGFTMLRAVRGPGGAVADFEWEYVNPVAAGLLRRPAAELVGRRLLEVLPHNSRGSDLFARYVRVVETGEPHDYELEYDGDGVAGWFRNMAVRAGDGVAVSFADITARKRAELALRASEERFRLAAEAVNGLIYDFDFGSGRVERTRGLLEVFGYRPEEVPPTADWWQDRIHPDDLPEMVRWSAAQVAAGDRIRTEYRVRHADGGWRWAEDRAVVGRDAAGNPARMVGCTTDVTDRKQAERDLAEAHQFLQSALDALSSHIAVLDEAGVILAVNEAWRRFAADNQFAWPGFGVGANYLAACEPAEAGCAEPGMAAGLRDVLAGRRDLFEAEYPCHSPTERRWFVMRATRFRSPGPVRVVVAHEDVTRLKLAEEGLREADRRKDEFLATLAHELRNPLAPIRTAVQILELRGDPSADGRRLRGVIERQVEHLVRLVDDLLDVSRISRGKIELRRDRVRLADVVQTAVETSGPLVEAGRHRLTVTLPPEPVAVDGDFVRLTQVVANLLNNAAKYTPEGGAVTVEVGREGPDAVVRVRDTGLGIPADMLGRVFDLFTQVNKHLNRSQGGLGIGLTLVRQLVELHGGTVAAHSGGDGHGAEFVVRLPAADAPGANGPPAAGGGPPGPAGHRVVVADDNADAAESLALLLSLQGHTVRTARDGEEAVAVAADFRPAVAVLDLGMPRLDGLAAARRIRAEPWGRGVVLVALTGWGQEADRRRSHEAGFDHHLTKPVDPDALAGILRAVPPAPA